MADLNYIESGYFTPEQGYYVYTADADAAISSSASITVSAGVIKAGSAALETTFTQTTYASRTKDIDLYAFSEAAIAVQVSVIRTTNIAATAVFDISTDGRRFRDIASAEDAVFNIDIVNERSRATSMETQAAFSITADVEVITPYIEGAADLTTTVDLSATVSKTTVAQASLDSLSDLSAAILKTSDTQASLDCHADLSVIISHIHGADIIASGFAELSAVTDVIRSADAGLDFQFDQQIICSRTRDYDSALNLVADVVADCGIIKPSDCTLTATVDLTAGVSVIVDFTSAVTVSTEVSTANDRLRSTLVDCSATSDVACVISHIHGADIIASGFAELSVNVEIIARVVSSINVQVSVESIISLQIEASSNITSSTFLLADPYEYTPRSVYSQTTQPAFSFAGIDYSESKFGSASLKIAPGDANPYHPFPGVGTANKAFPIYNGTDYRYISPGRTIITTNGIDFTSYSNNLPGGRIGDISWTGTYYITAIASGGDGPEYAINTIWYSIDGITWSSHTVHNGTNADYRTRFNKIQVRYFNGNYFLAVRYYNGIHILKSSALTGTYTTLVYSSLSSGFLVSTNSWTASYSDASRIVFAVGELGTSNRFAVVSTNGTSFSLLGSTSSTESSIEYITYVGSNYYLCQNSNAAGTGSFIQSSAGNITLSGLSNWIYYSNGNWFRKPSSFSNILQSATSIGSLSNKITLGNQKRVGIPITISGNSYFPVDDITYISSNNYTSYTTQTITGVSGLQGGVIYENADFTSIKTIDFWHKIADRNAGTVLHLSSDDNNNYISVTSKNDQVECRVDENDVSKYISGGTTSPNTWIHTRIVANGGTAALYVNGTRVSTVARGDFTNLGKLYLGTGFNVGLVNSNIWIDELLITDELLTDPSVTSFTVPSKSWKNTAQTDALLHFDGSLVDDSREEIIPSAFFSIITNVTANATITYNSYLADITTISTLSATISTIIDSGTELTAFSDANVFATVERIRSTDVSLEVLADLSTTSDRIRDITETFTATSLLVNDVSVTRETSVNTDAVFSELVAVAKIGDFLVSADVISEVAVQAVKTTETSATLAFDVAANIQAEKIVDAVCFMEPIGFLTLNDISVIRTTSATLTSNSEQNTVGEKLAGLVGNLQSEFNLTATSSGTIDAIALVMSSGTLAVTVERQRPGSATLDSAFTQTTETYDSLAKQGTAALEIIITTTSDVHRIRDVEIATDAVASELVAVGRIGQGFITCETYVTVDAQVVKTTDIDLTITAVSTVAVIADKLHSTAVAILDVNAALLAEGTTNITGEADLTVLANISADARRSRGFNSTITANSNLVCDTGRIRPFAELVVAAATLTSTASRIRSASSHFDAIASELVLGDAITGGSATLSAAFTLTAQGRDIDLTKYVYTIGSETRFHKIQSENRTRKIREETRIYKIRRV